MGTPAPAPDGWTGPEPASSASTGHGCLLLWDIDLTLLSAGAVAHEAYEEAFREVTGRAARCFPDWAGRTDRHLIRQMLVLNDVEPSADLVSRFADILVAAVTRRRELLAGRGRILSGARDALAAFAAMPGIVQSVLTGNLEPLAAMKLAAFGLDGYLDLTIGGFGGDHEIRGELLAFAWRRARSVHGLVFDASSTVLIGDTPHDVEAGRDSGAAVIGVATGRWSTDDLVAAGAHRALADLRDTPAVVRAVFGALGR